MKTIRYGNFVCELCGRFKAEKVGGEEIER